MTQMNLSTNRNRYVDIESRLVVAKEEGTGGRIREWEAGVSKWKLLYKAKWSEVKVAQSCPTLRVLMDNTVHGILQARILEWVPFPSPGDPSNPGIKPRSLALQVDSLPDEPQGKPKNTGWVACPFSSRSSWPKNRIRVSCIAGRFFTNWAIREAQAII